ncbi:MAG: AAA family ATPase [Planctomycetes bacterium]|nr:AAA family ATPase [Planctomycetota bacterium]
MQLIKSVEVDHFRSIQTSQTVEMGHFTAIAGLNNSGKSNLLRALHLFFTGKIEPSVNFDFAKDYNLHDSKSKKRAKNICVTVTFDLPQQFKFRTGLGSAKVLLGRNFSITKAWSRNSTTPKYLLNDTELDLEDRVKIDQFLSLINFRYIPNRVLPLDIVRNEHSALRDAIVRRLRRRLGKQDELFAKLKETSETLVEGIETDLRDATNVDGVRLDMPSSWKEFVFALGYKLTSEGMEFDDSVQGSGVQSLLMLQTLALIDKDYYQQFGWKQASFWAIEEPESSMHTSLEARVASFLAQLATGSDGRLQIIGTTHSDLMLQSADSIVMVSVDKGRTKCKTVDKRTGLTEAAKVGVSRFTHPLLAEPLCPVILVDGKYDHAFLEQAIRLLAPSRDIRVSFLEDLDDTDGATGGEGNLQKYLKSHQQLLSMRMAGAPIIVLLDWDSKLKVTEFEKYCSDKTRYKVFAWPDSSFNPALNKKFKGIERHMADRIIEEANSNCSVLGKTRSGAWTVFPEDYNKEFKPAVYDVVKAGITADDLVYVKDFVKELIRDIEE